MGVEFSGIRGLVSLHDKPASTARMYLAPKGTLDAQSPMVVKRYREEIIRGKEVELERHLKMLIGMNSKFPGRRKGKLTGGVVWPEQLVYDHGVLCGFAMPYIPDTFRARYQGMAAEVVADSTLGFILQDDDIRRSHGLPTVDKRARYVVTCRIVGIVAWLHRQGLIVGDISSNNIFVNIDPRDPLNDEVLLLDADSMRKEDTPSPLRQTHTYGWIPPECMRAHGEAKFRQNRATDTYKVCLAILRLYHAGDHRAAVVSSDDAIRRISDELSSGVARCVARGLSRDPRERPDCEQLLAALRDCHKAAR